MLHRKDKDEVSTTLRQQRERFQIFLEAQTRHRGVGNTTAAIHGPKNTPESVFVVHNHQFALQLKERYPDLAVITVAEFAEGRRLVGTDRCAVVFDGHVLTELLSDAVHAIKQAEAITKKYEAIQAIVNG